MAAETTADPTARDLLRIAVDYARRAEAGDTTAPVGGLAELFGNLARTAALIESTAPVEVDEFPDSVQCQTCGHLQGLHMQQTGCLACNRRGGLCETPYVVACPGSGKCYARDNGDGHKHMSDGRILPVESGSLVDLDALRRSVTGESAGTVNVRPLRPVNRGRFKLDGPTDAYPAVRREQAGTFGPPDVDATAEIPRATWSDERCETYGPNGGRCRSVKHGSHVDHHFPQPDDPDNIA